MLLDYQQNGFYFGNERFRQRKVEIQNKETSFPQILEIQRALVSHRTKLRAALARSRIRDCAISVEALLPKEEQDKLQYAAQQPVYARVNTWKASYSDILETLTTEGFLMEDNLPSAEDDDNPPGVRCFMKDQHFENLLVFPPAVKFNLYESDLVLEGKLAIQVLFFWYIYKIEIISEQAMSTGLLWTTYSTSVYLACIAGVLLG